MKSTERNRILVVVAALAFYLLTLHPPMQAQSGRSGEHWVGTWTTSDVGRPQTPPTPTLLGTGGSACTEPAPNIPVGACAGGSCAVYALH
jgi:hypothetical protein